MTSSSSNAAAPDRRPPGSVAGNPTANGDAAPGRATGQCSRAERSAREIGGAEAAERQHGVDNLLDRSSWSCDLAAITSLPNDSTE